MKRLTIAILLLTLNPVTVQPNQPQEARTVISSAPMTPGHKLNWEQEQNIRIRALICAYALKFHVEPAAAMAVAHIESRIGKKEFRVGPMGKGTFAGPMGIRRKGKGQWVDILEKNIRAGVEALSWYDNLEEALRAYNTEFDNAYWQEVLRARAKYRKGGVSDGIGNDRRRRFIPD